MDHRRYVISGWYTRQQEVSVDNNTNKEINLLACTSEKMPFERHHGLGTLRCSASSLPWNPMMSCTFAAASAPLDKYNMNQSCTKVEKPYTPASCDARRL